MTNAPVIHSLDARGVATVTLNRPEVGNAYNGDLIQGLLGAMDELATAPELRALLLKGNGRHFQAGADLAWIRSISRASPERTSTSAAPRPRPSTASTGCPSRRLRWCRAAASAAALVSLPPATSSSPPTTPSSRSPRCAGVDGGHHHSPAQRRHLGAPAAPLCADRRALRRHRGAAHRLAHQVVPLDRLAAAGEEMIARVLENGPVAMAETKALALECAWGGFDAATLHALVDSHAAKRRSPEAAEGLASFAEKRAARWSRE